MKTSMEINEIAKALAKAQGEIANAKADAENPHFKSKYADLASVRAVIQKPLAENGLSIVQLPIMIDKEHGLVTRIMHSSGQWIEDECVFLMDKSTMQALGSAITYLKRYALMAATGVAEDDDDGNEASKSPKKPTSQPKSITSGPLVTPKVTVPNQNAPKEGPDTRPATEAQVKMVWAKLKNELVFTDERAKEFIEEYTGAASGKDLNREHIKILLDQIEFELQPTNTEWDGDQ